MLLTECPMRVPRRNDDFMSDLGDMEKERLERTLTGLKLFAGMTTFESIESQTALLSLLPDSLAKEGAKHMIYLRGESHMLSRSDLENICFEQ